MQETQEMRVRALGQEDPLEEGMATHSSILAWRISWAEEPGRLQSKESQSFGLGESPFPLGGTRETEERGYVCSVV